MMRRPIFLAYHTELSMVLLLKLKLLPLKLLLLLLKLLLLLLKLLQLQPRLLSAPQAWWMPGRQQEGPFHPLSLLQHLQETNEELS